MGIWVFIFLERKVAKPYYGASSLGGYLLVTVFGAMPLGRRLGLVSFEEIFNRQTIPALKCFVETTRLLKAKV